MARYDSGSEIWRFETARFVVTCNVEDEDDIAPEDSFCMADDIAFASSGKPAAWFRAAVNVWLKRDPCSPCFYGDEPGELMGSDHLGGCSYTSFQNFLGERTGYRAGSKVTPGHYFPGMVREAIRDARGNLERQRAALASLHLRAVA